MRKRYKLDRALVAPLPIFKARQPSDRSRRQTLADMAESAGFRFANYLTPVVVIDGSLYG